MPVMKTACFAGHDVNAIRLVLIVAGPISLSVWGQWNKLCFC